MSIKDFFRKIGRGIGRVGKKVWGAVKKGAQFVGRLAKPIISIAKPVLGTIAALPGKVGLIGKVGSAAASVAKDLVDRIPNQEAKDKLNRVIDKGKDLVDKVQDKAQGVADKAKPWADAGLSVINKPPSLAPIKKVLM